MHIYACIRVGHLVSSFFLSYLTFHSDAFSFHIDLNEFSLFFSFSLLIYSYDGETPFALNLRPEYALPINKEFSVSVGK